jgi:hypothetical protein
MQAAAEAAAGKAKMAAQEEAQMQVMVDLEMEVTMYLALVTLLLQTMEAAAEVLVDRFLELVADNLVLVVVVV